MRFEDNSATGLLHTVYDCQHDIFPVLTIMVLSLDVFCSPADIATLTWCFPGQIRWVNRILEVPESVPESC